MTDSTVTPPFDKNAKRAKKPQPVSKRLQSRQDDYDGFIRGVDSKLRNGYSRPGSQNRNK